MIASNDSQLSKPFANLIDLIQLAGHSVWALALAGSLGCWEEIRYVPPPETVQSTADQSSGSGDEQTDGDAAAQAVGEGPDDLAAGSVPGGTNETAAAGETAPQPLDAPPLELPDQPVAELPPADPTPTDVSPPPSEEPTEGKLPGESPTEAPPSPPATEPASTSGQRLLIWQAAGKWSLAAAMEAKQLPAERYAPIRDGAAAAASELGLTLPPLPLPTTNQTLEQAVVEALGGEPTESFVEAASERFGAEASALAALAIRSNLLLLTYSPRRDDLAAQAAEFRTMAEASGLPSDAWTPLVDLLGDGGQFVAMRSAIFELHRRVDSLLAEASR